MLCGVGVVEIAGVTTESLVLQGWEEVSPP